MLERCCRPTYTRTIHATILIYHHTNNYRQGTLLKMWRDNHL